MKRFSLANCLREFMNYQLGNSVTSNVQLRRRKHVSRYDSRIAHVSIESLENRCLLSGVTSVVMSGAGIVAGNGDLNVGHEVTLTLNFNDTVTVDTSGGQPTLSLNDGNTAIYSGGSGSSSLTFLYTVATGDNTNNLTVTAFNLNGSVIQDSLQNNVDLSGAVMNPTGTLQIDTTLPFVQSISYASPAGSIAHGPAVSYTVTFSEPVSNVLSTDFQTPITGSIADSQIQVSPVSGSVYTVTVSGITGYGTLGLNLVDDGSIRDLAGNALTSPTSAPSFQSQQTFSVGGGASQVWVGDLNGDGIPDLVMNGDQDPSVASSGGNVIDVLLGNGDGTFQPQQTYAAGVNPNSFVVADLNGDGKPDIAAANYGNHSYIDNTISVLLNNGDGTFQPEQIYPVGPYPIQIAAADLNNDGKVDLITANIGGDPYGLTPGAPRGNTISILYGNGDGTFQPQQTIAVGNSPYWVSVGDLNGDGKPDVVVADAYDNTVSVLLNNGGGTFLPQQTFSTGLYPTSVAIADLNGDGQPDLVTANEHDGTISVLQGNGDGSFQTQQTYSTGPTPVSVQAADLNGDGKLDLVVTNNGDNTVGVFQGNGDGTFQPQQEFNVGAGPLSVAAASLTGNGRLDLVVANVHQHPPLAPSTGSILFNNVNGDFTGQVYTIPHPPATVTSVTTSGTGIVSGNGDLNAGHTVTLTVNFDQPEWVVTAGGFPTLTLNDGQTATYLSGSGTSSLTFIYTVSPGDNTPDLAVTRLKLNGATIRNSDGVDANLGGAATNPNGILKIDTTLPYVQSINFGSPTGSIASGPSVTFIVTFDEAVSGVSSNSFQVVTTGNVTDANTVVTPVSGSVYNVKVTGIKGAGKLGLNLVDDGTIRDLAGNALTSTNANASFQSRQTFAVGGGASQVWVGDVNGDGIADIVSNGGNAIDVLLGNGDGTFQPEKTYAVGSNPNSFVVADLNGDGKPDIVAANYGSAGSISVLIGNGDGTFQTQQTFATGSYPISVAVANLNGDGKPDVVVSNFGGNSGVGSGNTISLLLGNGDGTFQPQQTVAVGNSPYWVTAGDLNGDGKADLVVADAADNKISVLLGNGDGTFQPQKTFFTGLYPTSVAIGDLNGDGKSDIVVTNHNSNTLSVLLGNGNGTFQNQQTFAVGTNPTSVQVADMNGDGKADLIVANSGTSTVGVLLGNGNGTFLAQQTFAAGKGTRNIAIGDLNGDGRLDIVTADTQQHPPLATSSGSLFLSSANGNFTGAVYTIVAPPTVTAPTATNITPNSAILGGNVTGDGGSQITERGIYYAMIPANLLPLSFSTTNSMNPLNWIMKKVVAGTTGIFTTSITGLTPGATYGFAAYAKNAAGTTYSTISFFTAGFAAPTQIGLPQPLPPTLGAGSWTGRIVAQVEDSFGNVVKNDLARTLTLSVNGQVVATGTDLNGIVTFNSVQLTKLGPNTITVSASNLSSSVSTIVVGPGVPTHLVLLPPPIGSGATTTIGVGQALNGISVAIADVYNNIVTMDNSPIVFSVNTLAGGAPAGANPLAGPPTITYNNGATTFSNFVFNYAGTYSFTFVDGAEANVQNVTSNVIHVVSPNQGPTLAVSQGLPITPVTAGIAITPAVKIAVKDQNGNTITSDNSIVTLAIAGGGTFANGQTSVSVHAVGGVATFTGLTLNKSGTYSLIATDNATAFHGVVLNVGSVQVKAAAATKLVFQSALPSSLTVGSVSGPIVILVEDRFGNIVTSDNSSVVTLKLNGGTLASVTVSSGVATFGGIQLSRKGVNLITATKSGLTSAVGTITGK